MDLIRIYQDYRIPYLTDGHKHCRPGWVNVPCPFCTGNPGYHLGAPYDGSHFYCWRCGWHPKLESLQKVLRIDGKAIKSLILEYGGSGSLPGAKTDNKKINLKPFKYPSGTEELGKAHIRYLEKRGFDPDQLVREWDLKATGFLSLLDKIDYSKRIIAPFYWKGKVVTFQGRDITDRHPLKYLACPMEREEVHHKYLLYGREDKWGDTLIIVEGITDVWRFGYSAAATMGIEFTSRQVRQIAKHCKKAVIIFDDESQAVLQAEKLVNELRFRGVNAWRQPIEGDPGAMDQEEANYLVKSLL